MNISDIEHKARLNDGSREACGRRLRSARMAVGLSQAKAAEALDIRASHLSNMEVGRQFPSLEVMRWFHRLHGIDFNYLMNGEIKGLSMEVRTRLLAALDEIDRTADP